MTRAPANVSVLAPSLYAARKILHDLDVILERLRRIIGVPGDGRFAAERWGERAKHHAFVRQPNDLLGQQGDAQLVGDKLDRGNECGEGIGFATRIEVIATRCASRGPRCSSATATTWRSSRSDGVLAGSAQPRGAAALDKRRAAAKTELIHKSSSEFLK